MINEMKKLISDILNYNDHYYNKNISLVSDYVYDEMFDRLKTLEEQTGIVLSNSPTHNVGATVVEHLNKVEHNHPMLSLDKTKETAVIKSFIKGKRCLGMLKMDGLTISLRYIEGKLVSAETRGNGHIGEDVLHTVKTLSNLPLEIPVKHDVVIDGEAIINLKMFKKINKKRKEELEKTAREKGMNDEELKDYVEKNLYKNSRNLASGSIRQLNSDVTKQRHVEFVAWKCVKGIDDDSFINRLNILKSWGFCVVPYDEVASVEDTINTLQNIAEKNHYPIDGIVFSYDSVSYGDSLGATERFIKSQMAFKFYDDMQETVLKNVEWSIGRTGILTPVALFEPVDIDGTSVERASLHNVTLFKAFELGIGDQILVHKANMIIPQVSENMSRTNSLTVPDICPICGGETTVVKDNASEILICKNSDCSGKQINILRNFVSKNGMDITGLSRKTLEKLISVGFITDFYSIYKLKEIKHKLLTLDGFGKKKVENLLEEIESSKNISLEHFLCALGIPGLGISNCKVINKKFKGDFEEFSKAMEKNYNFSQLNGFGESINRSIHNYWKKNYKKIIQLSEIMNWNEIKESSSEKFAGFTFVITGETKQFKNRDELKDYILSNGGKVVGSVSKNTNYLINNDIFSESSKNKKAKQLRVPIITEEELLKK